MTWRIVVISKTCKLELKTNYLIIRDSEIKRVNLSEIAVLIVENTAISITAALLCELSKNKIKVIFCDEKRNPYGEILSYYGSHDSTDKLRTQISWEKDIKGCVWAEIVRNKIIKQSKVLIDKGLFEQAELLDNYAKEIKHFDNTNREGHAAKVYFNALFGMNFSRKSENATNACLNYGYAVLLSAINREISIAGYFTQLGIFHDNMYNQFNLGSDLIEPFRTFVDRLILEIDPEDIGPIEKMRIVDLLNREVTFDGKKYHLITAIRPYCKGVFDALNECDVSRLRFCE